MAKQKPKKFQNRSDRPPAAVVANRREKVAELLGKKTQAEIAKVVGAPLRTVERDTAALRRTFKDNERFGEFVAGLVDLYINDYEQTRASELPPEVATACRGILDSICRVTGANAPTRSESQSTSLNVNGSPEQLIGYRRFVKETGRLSAESMEKVFAYARTLVEAPKPIEFNVPATSELWDDEPAVPLLTEGEPTE